MITFAVLNQKGGAGKTTIATNVAAAAHLDKKRTLLVDLDVQSSSLDWFHARKEGSSLDGLAVVKADLALALSRFREIGKGYDVVILDGPPRISDVTRAAAIAADVVLVPIQPSSLDFWAAKSTVDLLDEADGLRAELGRPKVRRLFVINRAITNSALARSAPAAFDRRELAACLHQRVAFPEACELGESVLTTEPKSEAAVEVLRLWKVASRLRGAA